MRLLLVLAWLVAISSVFSGQSLAAEVRLHALEVEAALRAGVPYEVRLQYTKTGSPRVTRACFLWSGEGPYCFQVQVGNRTIRARLRTGNPNHYRLEGFVVYRADGQTKHSNRVTAPIHVR